MEEKDIKRKQPSKEMLEKMEEKQRKRKEQSKDMLIDETDAPIDYFFLQHGISYDTINPIKHWDFFVLNIKEKLQVNYIFKYNLCNSGLYKTLDGIEILLKCEHP